MPTLLGPNYNLYETGKTIRKWRRIHQKFEEGNPRITYKDMKSQLKQLSPTVASTITICCTVIKMDFSVVEAHKECNFGFSPERRVIN